MSDSSMLAFQRQSHLSPEPCREPTRMHVHSHTHELTLGLSFFLGAVHALEPGHGKTAMFIYLLEGRRSFWHPIVMALSTAFSHSVSLFVIAFGVHLAHHVIVGDHHHAENISSVLQWLSALLVVAVGGFLLVRAMRGRSVRCCGHHHHGPCSTGLHDHADGDSRDLAAHLSDTNLVQLRGFETSQTAIPLSNPAVAALENSTRPSYRTTAILGLAVGLLPCPTAMAAYFTGLSSGSPGTTYLIIGVFAAGIACSLSLVGILLQYFGDRFGHHSERLVRLPWNYIRASLILGIGLTYLARLITDAAA